MAFARAADRRRRSHNRKMFGQLNEPRKTPRVSGAMTLGIFAAYLIGAFGGLVLFIALGDRPFGTQAATAIVYTYAVFWYVFFPTRGMEQQHSLRDRAVQRQIPRLLMIHCVFLILIFLVQTVLFASKSRLPSYWLTQYGKQRDTLYEGVLILSFVIVFFTQVLISRQILSHSVNEDLDKLRSG